MKKCFCCGAEIEDNARFCPRCGANQAESAKQTSTATAEPVEDPLEKHTGLTVLGFFFPIIALIMWLVWQDSEPSKAWAIGKGGLMVLCLNSPIIGLLCYLLLRDSHRDVAKACGICAIIGVVIAALAIIVLILIYIIYFVWLSIFLTTAGISLPALAIL